MAIATDFDYVSRCTFWSVHLRADKGNILPLATLAHARRMHGAGHGADPGRRRQASVCRYAAALRGHTGPWG